MDSSRSAHPIQEVKSQPIGRPKHSTGQQREPQKTRKNEKSAFQPQRWMIATALVGGLVVGSGVTYIAGDSGNKSEDYSSAREQTGHDRDQSQETQDARAAEKESENDETTIDDLPKIGEPAFSGDEKVVIDSVEMAPTVQMWDWDTPSNTVDSSPKNNGAKFVIVKGTVFNEGNLPFDARFDSFAWITDHDRMYDTIEDHGRLKANEEYLNDSIGPGFSTPYVWVFEVPSDFVPTMFGFDDSVDHHIGNNTSFIDVRGATT